MTAAELLEVIHQPFKEGTPLFSIVYDRAGQRKEYEGYVHFMSWDMPSHLRYHNLKSNATGRCEGVAAKIVAALYAKQAVSTFSADVVRYLMTRLDAQETTALILEDPRLAESGLWRERMYAFGKTLSLT